jgi:nucleoside phosphorylase
MTPPTKPLEDFSVAVICPLEVEALAMIAQLDEDKDYGEAFSKDCQFTLGGIGDHNIVITSLPGGRQGHSSAAIAAQQTMTTFPKISCTLLVGIAGGVPSEKNDIRLGDIVVSFPTGRYGGVVQYDFGKEEEQFEHNGHINAVPQQLIVYLQSMKLSHAREKGKRKFVEYLNARMTEGLEKPDGKTDSSALGGPSQIQEARDEPYVHYGLIASGNRVMKNAEQRDKYAKAHGGYVLAYEMEAAGLMNFTPCLVIRGISDYADAQKSPGKVWHEYAAAGAASFAREFIEKVPAEIIPDHVSNGQSGAPKS